MKLQATAIAAPLLCGTHATDMSHGPPDATSIHTSNNALSAAVTQAISPTEMHPTASTFMTATRTMSETDDTPTEIYNMVAARGGLPELARDPIQTQGLGSPPIPVIRENLVKAVHGVDKVCDECKEAKCGCGCDAFHADPPRNPKEEGLRARLEYARKVVDNWCWVCKKTKLDCGCKYY